MEQFDFLAASGVPLERAAQAMGMNRDTFRARLDENDGKLRARWDRGYNSTLAEALTDLRKINPMMWINKTSKDVGFRSIESKYYDSKSEAEQTADAVQQMLNERFGTDRIK